MGDRKQSAPDPAEQVFVLKPRVSKTLGLERDRVLGLLRRILPGADISEVGSTAVQGAIGKQDVDIAVLVPGPGFPAARDAIDRVLERDPMQYSSGSYQGYRASRVWNVAVQLTVKGGAFDSFHRFNAALRADPALLKRYNDLKREWSGKPMRDYREAKSLFIEQVLRGEDHPD